jgi:choice-of-anchor B domain-containing protein
MKKFTKFSVFALFFLLLSANTFGQSLNMTLASTWIGTAVPNNPLGFKYSDIWGWAGNGREYAIIGSSTKIHFVDVTNPTTPIEVAYHLGESNTGWREFRTYNNYLYAITEAGSGITEGLKVFDLNQLPSTPPAMPIVINKVNTNQNSFFTTAHMLFVDEVSKRLYVSGTNTQNNGLIVLDLATTPNNPTFIRGDNLTGGYVHDLFVKNNKVYTNQLGNGLRIFDYTSVASAPIELGSLTAYIGNEFSHSGWLCNSGAYIMCDEIHNTVVKSINVSDPTNITVVDTFYSNLTTPSLQSIAHNPYAVGDLAFISYYHDGILVYDVSNPSDIVKVGHYDTDQSNTNYNGYIGAWGVYPFFYNGTNKKIIVSDVNLGLKVIELTTECGAPSLLTLSTPGTNSIGLNWNDRPSAINYKVRYKMALATTWTEVVVPASASDLTVFGLTSNTDYIVQVASQCPYGYTEYAKQYTFRTAAALPIELTNFEGKTTKNGIQLTWKTALETDFSHFELQHSKDGLSFEKLTEITGKGIQGKGADYTFLDTKPFLNTNYYRLKSIDLNEKFEYSPIIAKANWVDNQLPSVKFITYENQSLRIQLENATNQSFECSIIDITGRLLLNKKMLNINSNDVFLNEDLTILNSSSQLVFVQIKFEDGRIYTQKITIL